MAYSEEFTGRKFNEDIYRNVNRLREPKRYDEAPRTSKTGKPVPWLRGVNWKERCYHSPTQATATGRGRNLTEAVAAKKETTARNALEQREQGK